MRSVIVGTLPDIAGTAGGGKPMRWRSQTRKRLEEMPAAPIVPPPPLQPLAPPQYAAASQPAQLPAPAAPGTNDWLQKLQQAQAARPGEYASPYAARLEELYKQINTRGPFAYDMNGDALYQQYKDRFMRQGRQAMQDTMGQAAAMTGGYANSFAQTAGQQAYDARLQQLNDLTPQLYAQKYNEWLAQGQDLKERLGLTQQLEQAGYGRYRDSVGDWQNQLALAASQYQHAADMQNADAWRQKQMEFDATTQQRAAFFTAQERAYQAAMAMLQMGQVPHDGLLAQAGLDRDTAAHMAQVVRQQARRGR